VKGNFRRGESSEGNIWRETFRGGFSRKIIFVEGNLHGGQSSEGNVRCGESSWIRHRPVDSLCNHEQENSFGLCCAIGKMSERTYMYLIFSIRTGTGSGG
jgi:hypothetical protein